MTIAGRLGRDGELRRTQKGTAVLSFSIPDDVGYGEKKRTNWISCSIFGERAEKLEQYLTKGSMVMVTGAPDIETYESKGETKAVIRLVVSEVKLLGGGEKADKPVADKGRATRGHDDADSEIPW
jgi:single-strand DNA-binding protein